MNENRRRTMVIIFITVSVFLVVIIGATYAYFSSSKNTGGIINAGVGTASKTYSFIATPHGNIEMDIDFNEMSQANVSESYLKTDNATIDVSLASPADDMITTCTYDIVWVWDSDENNRYTEPDVKLPYTHTDGKEYNYEFSTTVDGANETDLSNVETNDNILTLKKGELIKSYGINPVTKTYDIAAYIYNLPVNQAKLFGKNFKAHIKVNNLICNMEDYRSAAVKINSTYNGKEAIPATVGAIGNAAGIGGVATYNQKYNQLEITSLTADRASFDLTYTDRTNTENLVTKVKSLEGNGQVFNEVVTKDKSTFTPTDKLEYAHYRASLVNDASYPWKWNSVDKSWTSTNKGNNTTTSTIKFKPDVDGR